MMRTEIRNLRIKHQHSYPSYLFYTIYYSFVLLLLFLSSMNDRPAKDSTKKNKNICPEEECSFLSRLFFSWIETLAWKGFRKPLTDEDLYDLRDQDSARHVVVNFDYHWTKKQHRKKRTTNPKVSVLPICLEAFLSTFIFGILLRFSSDLLSFVNPQILSLLINFVKQKEEHWKGYFYAVLLLSTGIIKSLLSVQYSHKANVIGLRIRVALNSIIYRKALKLSSRARRKYTVGEIVNLISNDTKNIADLPPNIISVISAIIQVFMSLYFLWRILGIAVFSGLIVMILMIPISSFISNKLKTLQTKKMKSSDQRIKQTNELLNNFKVLKLYAWEPIFHSNILRVREEECHHLKNSVFYNVGYSFVWLCAPFLVSLVCFATYVLIDDKNILDAQVAFVSLSLFNILRVPLNTLPVTLSNIVQASVSLVRVNKMLGNEELDPSDVTHHEDVYPLTIKNGVFGWGEEPTLRNINISLPKSSLTAVVGTVGSGKSTLLSSFLGETHRYRGQVNTLGQIAYVPQQAWIQNATLRNNILFGKPFDRLKYQRVVSACALKSDFEALPGGDNTEIGEKGVNLSGGQRQRISLARAVYADADIYFLDDPLSAVDTRVGRHIFEKVIGPRGLLSTKTRVFVTHGITYLPQTDKVIVMKNGEVSECGTYQQLLDKKGDFSDFLMNHLNDESDEYSKEQLCSQKTEIGVDSMQMSVMSYDKLLLSSQDDLLDDSRLTDIEKLETGSVGWDVYKYYLKTIGWKMITAAIFSNFFMHLLNIGCKVWLSIWSTDQTMVNNGTNDHNKTLFYLGIYSTFGFGKSLIGIFAVLAPQIGGVYAAIKLHQSLLHRIVHAPMSFFDTTPTGRLLSRFAKDIGTVDYKLAMFLYEGINSFFIVIGTLIVTSYTAPVFIAVVIPLGLVYYLIQKFYIETSRQLKRLEAISRSPIYSLFNESIAGAPVIRAFKVDRTFTNDFEKKCDFNNSCYYLSMISNRWMSLRLEILGNLIVFFSVLFSVTVKHLNAGLLGLSITYALEITETLNYLVRIASEVETNIVSVERIREYTQAPQEAPWDNSDVYISSSWPEKGIVEFRSFGVKYRPGLELVLRNINFQTKQNEKIGIVGRTGAGKSSLTLSLFRILEAAEGEILIDGVNLATLGLQTLRSRITIIPQDAVLFSGTLRLNLDPYNKYTDSEIWQTLEHAHLKSFIQTFPDGLECSVSEGGENFSLGQKQLICLGRALLRKTKVLILDEATAAVDLETDNLIQRTIRHEFSECTVLTIAHRLNTILDYDRVIVLNKGAIEEFDSPSKLLKNRGLFYNMCKDAGITQ
ncbi:multidrug resistance-associated protein 1-like isoform X2 [Coccinella septempunctata]|uniref:multidrug resistance-associated protein 1-like isoform X2 n=1 Tax=Coccinella septempunctata TaxID=41139 RepID=UPI001D078601|nr:multidrug resistance-associated protein 1-like isoform X2 [Coccinella septempunctata]